MAETIKRYDLVFALELNKHPKVAKNLSMIDARNIRISNDKSCIVKSAGSEPINNIYQKLHEHFSDNNYYYEIVHIIPCNNELVLFVASSYYIDDYNIIQEKGNFDESAKNIHRYLNIFRYNELTDICTPAILEYELIDDETYPIIVGGMNYYDGEFSSTFTYNANNELIIAFCEYDSKLKTESGIGEPLKTINLGYWDENNNIVNTNNLNVKTFPICPEVRIPRNEDVNIVNGLSKKGWYHFYIRYKIDDANYTHWFDFGEPIYLDEFHEQNIFKYDIGYVQNPSDPQAANVQVDKSYLIKDTFSNTLDVCNKSIEFKLNGLDETYSNYQIGFVCSTKTYTEAKHSDDININNNLYKLDYQKNKDIDINEFIKVYNNYYNVKNIINYNNRLYISNYVTLKNYVDEKPDITFYIRQEEVSTESTISKYEIYRKERAWHEIFNAKLDLIVLSETFTSYKNSLTLNEIVEGKTFVYNTKVTKSLTLGPYDSKENFYNRFVDLYNNSHIRITNIWYYSKYNAFEFTKGTTGSSTLEDLRYILNSKYLKECKVTYYEYTDAVEGDTIIYTFNKDTNKFEYSGQVEYKYYEHYDLNRKQDSISIYEYDFYDEYVVKETDSLNNNINLNNINYSLKTNQPYIFYIHYVNKYGEYTDGININLLRKKLNLLDGGNNRLEYINGNLTFRYINLVIINNSLAPRHMLFILKENVYINGEINQNGVYINIDNDYCLLKDYLDLDVDSQETKDSIISVINNILPTDSLFDINSCTFGEILHQFNPLNDDIKLANNIYVSRNEEIGIILNTSTKEEILGGATAYPYKENRLYSIILEDIEIPEGYVDYFISYAKIEDLKTHEGVRVRNLILEDFWGEGEDAKFSVNENELNHLITYNDNLNYQENINTDANKVTIKRLQENGIESLKIYLQYFETDNIQNVEKIEDIKYHIADSLITDNLNLSTSIRYILDEETTYSELYYIIKAYKNISTIYQNINKTLIRCSQITNAQNIKISTYSHFEYSSALVSNIHGTRLNGKNTINYADNSKYYGDELMYLYFKFPSVIDNFEASKSFNNEPKSLMTIKNDVAIGANNPEYFINNVFVTKDTIDLFNNNSLRYDDSVLSIYKIYVKENLNKYEFNKTIRRSNYITDESLLNGFRNFEPENYKNIIENKGNIVNIVGIGTLLLVHTEHSLFQFDKNALLEAINRTVQLGEQDTFNVPYNELFTSQLGFGGIQNKKSYIVGEYGYIYYNKDFNKLYKYDSGKLTDIGVQIDFFLSRYKPHNAIFVDNKETNEIICQFYYYVKDIEHKICLIYDYVLDKFVSILDIQFNNFYNTKTNTYILIDDKLNATVSKLSNDNPKNSGNVIYYNNFNTYVYKDFVKITEIQYTSGENRIINTSSIKFIINENYDKLKQLDFIKYKLYKRNINKGEDYNTLPVEEYELFGEDYYITKRTPYSGFRLRVYNDLFDTGELNIETNLKGEGSIYINHIEKPYYNLGSFTFNNLRDKDNKNQIKGNWFIVEFMFDYDEDNQIEFEELSYSVSYESN